MHTISGIWADDSDNENDTKHTNSRKPKNYTAPIGFVAGGVQQAGKKGKKGNLEVKQEGDDSAEEDKPSTSFKIRDSSSESESEVPRMGNITAHFPKSCFHSV